MAQPSVTAASEAVTDRRRRQTACRNLSLAVLATAALFAGCASPTQPGTTTNNRPTLPDARGLACGADLVCNAATQYCSVMRGGPVGVPPSYACTALPQNCSPTPTCQCLQVAIGCSCAEPERGRLTVTCNAP